MKFGKKSVVWGIACGLMMLGFSPTQSRGEWGCRLYKMMDMGSSCFWYCSHCDPLFAFGLWTDCGNSGNCGEPALPECIMLFNDFAASPTEADAEVEQAQPEFEIDQAAVRKSDHPHAGHPGKSGYKGVRRNPRFLPTTYTTPEAYCEIDDSQTTYISFYANQQDQNGPLVYAKLIKGTIHVDNEEEGLDDLTFYTGYEISQPAVASASVEVSEVEGLPFAVTVEIEGLEEPVIVILNRGTMMRF